MSRDVTDELIAELEAADEDSAEAWKRRALQAEAAIPPLVKGLHILMDQHAAPFDACSDCRAHIQRLIPAAYEEETR